MTTKLNNLLGNSVKDTANVDAISDKIAQNVIKILLSSNKLESLNLKGRKDLSGGRKLGNIDTAKYTTISENQNTRMRKGDGVANVLSRLYGLLKGSHDEDVKQMELTRNFKEEKLKETKKYSKITHQSFGKRRRKITGKSSLTGLVILGLISSADSIMDWLENFTAEGGGLDKMVSEFTKMLTDPDSVVGKLIQGGTDLFSTIQDITAKEMDKQSAVWENFKKDISYNMEAISGVYDNIQVAFNEVLTKVKEFFTNISPLDIFEPDKWLEFLKIVPNAFGNMFDNNSSVLDEYNKKKETLPKEKIERGDFFAKAANPENKDKGVVAPLVKNAVNTVISGSANISKAAEKTMPQKPVASLSAAPKAESAVSKIVKLSKKDIVTPTTKAFGAGTSYVSGELQKLVENTKSESDSYSQKLPDNSMYLLSDEKYHPPVRQLNVDRNQSKPMVINNPTVTTNPPSRSSGQSGSGNSAACRNENGTIKKASLKNVCGI